MFVHSDRAGTDERFPEGRLPKARSVTMPMLLWEGRLYAGLLIRPENILSCHSGEGRNPVRLTGHRLSPV
jgi:hypothetical protein